MSPREPQTPAPPAAPGVPDAFALAMARLAAQRPLHARTLQQAAAQLQAGQVALAQATLDAHLARRPDDPDALSLRARTALRQGRRDEAIALLDRCLALAPDFAAARFNRANLLFQQARHDEALAEAAWLLQADGANPLLRQFQALVLEALGDSAQAVAVHAQLAAEHPRRLECWLNLGHAQRAAGAQAEAIAAYRRAIACRPSCGSAWWSLANLRTLAFDAADRAALQAQLARDDLASEDRIALHYALGKAHEDFGDVAAAFAQYALGNAASRRRIRYDPATLGDSVARHEALFTPSFLAARAGAGDASPAPIFIVSRPRSGSTLVEQILASHPDVEATAELPYIGAIVARLAGAQAAPQGAAHLPALAALPPAELAALGAEYLQRAQRHRRLDRPLFIDKMPANFLHVGLIALILPNARIIDVRRHPVACALSIFKSYSSKGSLALDELGRYHCDYVRMMAHYDRVLPGRVLRVHYEALVRDAEGQVRRLLDALGLPFDERCLRFHETRRTVQTPSSEQVRRPLFSDAVDHWRRFEPWLGPLIASLGPLLDEDPAGITDFPLPTVPPPPSGPAP